MISDLKYALRGFARTPGFTAAILLTLAFCLGANLAIFAAIDAVLLRPLPFPESERLVTLFNAYPKAGAERAGATVVNYYERRDALPALSSLSIFGHGSVVVGEAGGTAREKVLRVSAEFFATLGVSPALGRFFSDEEMTFQTDLVVVLTDAYWRQQFNADPDVIGRKLTIDGLTKTIVGVLPAEFRFLSSEARLCVPLASAPAQRVPAGRHIGNGDEIIARLAPGATVSEAQRQVDAHNAALEQGTSVIANTGFNTHVVSLHADHVRAIRPVLVLLQAGVLFLLLIGAVNVVNLLLIRASGRAKELAIRQSMGASRRHIVQQVLTEALALTGAGAALGLLVGAWGVQLLEYVGADRFPLGATIAFDGRVAAAAALGAVALTTIIATPVAWLNLRGNLTNALQSESRSGTPTCAAQRVRHGFIVTQIVLAFVLLVGAGLLGVSLDRAMTVSPGFRADHIITGHISLPFRAYPGGAARVAFANRLADEIAKQPGVTAVGITTVVPLSGNGHVIANTPEGTIRQAGEPFHAHQTYGVAGDYFTALGYTLHEGRFLNADDSRRADRVCVVDADFARRYWPNGSAVGQRVFQGTQATPSDSGFTIVGVVGPVKQAQLTESEARGAVYYPYQNRANDAFFVVARTAAAPDAFAATLRDTLRQVDPGLPLDDIRTMDVRIAESLTTRRSPALLSSVFAVVSLLLAAIGTYGVLAFAVSQRRREIGVRMALGAQPRQVLSQFLRLGVRLLLLGLTLGLFGAWGAGRAMQTMLFGVAPLDLGILAIAGIVIASVVLLAVLIPSLRAAGVNPIEALRDE